MAEGGLGEKIVGKSSSERLPRVRPVTADELRAAVERLETVQGELAAVVELMGERKHKHLSLTGWGKFERAVDLLQQFSAHVEYALKTARS